MTVSNGLYELFYISKPVVHVLSYEIPACPPFVLDRRGINEKITSLYNVVAFFKVENLV